MISEKDETKQNRKQGFWHLFPFENVFWEAPVQASACTPINSMLSQWGWKMPLNFFSQSKKPSFHLWQFPLHLPSTYHQDSSFNVKTSFLLAFPRLLLLSRDPYFIITRLGSFNWPLIFLSHPINYGKCHGMKILCNKHTTSNRVGLSLMALTAKKEGWIPVSGENSFY